MDTKFLQLSWMDEIEDLEEYRPGGFHPVLLGDCLPDGGRYQVLHKLGSGGYATVWLCRDSIADELVAIKINRADQSRESCVDLRVCDTLDANTNSAIPTLLAIPQGHFWISGPNGRHLCLVLPVLGPRIDTVWTKVHEPYKFLRKAAFQTCKGLSILHRHGIAHRDLRPANILLRISKLDAPDTNALYQILGEPKTEPVLLVNGGAPGPEAPRYIVHPINFRALDAKTLTNEICIIDFGTSFIGADQYRDIGIPTAYCPPEAIADTMRLKRAMAGDVWALGCSIFEIITGHSLFEEILGDEQEVFLQWEQLLGRMPDAWQAESSAQKDVDKEAEPLSTSESIRVNPTVRLEKYLAESITAMDAIGGAKHTLEVPQGERGSLANLLSTILQYDPLQRPSVDDVLGHDYWRPVAEDP